jgi:hypothetical protein
MFDQDWYKNKLQDPARAIDARVELQWKMLVSGFGTARN